VFAGVLKELPTSAVLQLCRPAGYADRGVNCLLGRGSAPIRSA
jgi:hypothetical protein